MQGIAAFEAFAGLLPEAMLLLEADGTIAHANQAAGSLFGLSPPDLVGRHLGDLSDQDRQAAAELIRLSSRSRTLLPGAITFRGPAGGATPCRCEGGLFRPRSEDSPALILLRVSTREAAANRFVALNLRIEELTREVTRRRAAEFALQTQTNRLRVTLGSIGDAVIATDSRGNITLMNAVAQALTGWSIDDAFGKPLDSVFVIVNEYTRAEVESPVARVLREGGVVGLANHTLLIARDGTERPIDDSGAPIQDDEGNLLGVVLVFHDITERHRMERELQAKTLKLEQADKRKDDFLSMLAHELRNPLAPLATGVQLLRRSAANPEEVVKLASMMGRQLAHMTRLVDDLLDVARLTRGSIELKKVPVRLAEVMEQAVEMSRPLIQSREQRFSTAAPPDVLLEADATRLVQVFSNLLNNASKYTPVRGEISLTARVDGAAVVVAVQDSGDGIEPSLLPGVFDLFTQGKRSLDRSQGGLGIGLTVVRAITHMHGGEVSARSDGVAQGSTFEVRLPLRSGTPQPLPPPLRATTVAPAPLGPRVLVVDDNEDAASSLAAMITEWGYEAQTAHGAAQALQQFAEAPPQVALLDIGMPGMDGYALARRIRQTEPGPGVLLLAVTGYGQESDRLAGVAAGFDHFLTKPVDLDELERILAAHRAAPQR